MTERIDERDDKEPPMPPLDTPGTEVARRGLARASERRTATSALAAEENSPLDPNDTIDREVPSPNEIQQPPDTWKDRILRVVDGCDRPMRPGEIFFEICGIPPEEASSGRKKHFFKALRALREAELIKRDEETHYITKTGVSYPDHEVFRLLKNFKTRISTVLEVSPNGMGKRRLFYEVTGLNKSDATPQQSEVFHDALRALLASGAVVEKEFEDPTIRASDKSVRRLFLADETTKPESSIPVEVKVTPTQVEVFTLPVDFKEQVLVILESFPGGLQPRRLFREIFQVNMSEVEEDQVRAFFAGIEAMLVEGSIKKGLNGVLIKEDKESEPTAGTPQAMEELLIPVDFREKIEELLETNDGVIRVNTVINAIFPDRSMSWEDTRSIWIALNRLITIRVLTYAGGDKYRRWREIPGEEGKAQPRRREIPGAGNEIDAHITASGIRGTAPTLPQHRRYDDGSSTRRRRKGF